MNGTLYQDGANNSTVDGLLMSTKITISVLTGVAIFGFVVIIIIIVCHLIQMKKKKKIKKSGLQNTMSNQMEPTNSHYLSPSNIPPPGAYLSDSQCKEFDNWAYTPDQYDYPDVVSDLNRKNTAGTRDIRWTTINLRALDNYDYERYGQIPRAKLFVRKEEYTS